MNKEYRSQNPEVFYTTVAITLASETNVAFLKQLSSHNPRKRIRLCTHDNPDNRLHEMLIVHERSAYVRPHKHLGKTESMHIIEGLVDVVIFDESGHIDRIISMGDYASGKTFYYRMATPVFHTLIIRSEVLVFHETTNGPFDRGDVIFASWAPEDGDVDAVSVFMTDLAEKVRIKL